MPTRDEWGDWRVATKSGTSANGAVNDIGVVWPPLEAPVLMIAYTNGPGTPVAAGEAAIARVAELVAREFGLLSAH